MREVIILTDGDNHDNMLFEKTNVHWNDKLHVHYDHISQHDVSFSLLWRHCGLILATKHYQQTACVSTIKAMKAQGSKQCRSINLSHCFHIFSWLLCLMWLWRYNKNIERHTAHIIVSWPNPKQWIIVHTSDLMMIIRQSVYSLDHYRRNGQTENTQPHILYNG